LKKVLITLLTFSFSFAVTVDELIKEAVKNSPYIKEKEIDMQVSHLDRKSSSANRYGEIKLYGSFFRYEDNRVLYPIAVPLNPADLVGAQEQFIGGISYFVPLFMGFKNIENVKISSIKENISKIDYKLTKNQLVYNIKSTYTKILELQEQRKALTSYLQALKKLEEDIAYSVSLGRKAEIDLLKVQYNIKQTKSNLDKIKNSIEYLKFSLKTLVGKEDIDTSSLEQIEFQDINQEKENVDIHSLEKIKKIDEIEKLQQKKLKIAKGDYYPHIFLLASAQRNYGNGEYKDLYQIGLKIDYTLFDFGKRKSRYLKSKLELSKVYLQKRKLVLDTQAKIKKALADIKSAQSKIEATKKQLELAKKIEETEKVKYEEGISDLYNYLYAKTQVISAKSSYYTALYEKQRAIYFLQYILEEFKDE